MNAMLQPNQTISVFLVDDQSMLRAAFRSLLAQDSRFEVVGDSGDARKAIEEIAELRPDVVLLDITMPGLSGLDARTKVAGPHRRGAGAPPRSDLGRRGPARPAPDARPRCRARPAGALGRVGRLTASLL